MYNCIKLLCQELISINHVESNTIMVNVGVFAGFKLINSRFSDEVLRDDLHMDQVTEFNFMIDVHFNSNFDRNNSIILESMMQLLIWQKNCLF